MLTQVYHLLLPSIPLVLILFGYIARMARAGMIEALDAEYTRTAVLKGLPLRTVIWRHVLRNALLPTISVIATQTAYLIGGLVVIETLFHYQGIGSLIFTAANKKDFPMLQAGVLTVGAIFTLGQPRGRSAVRPAQSAHPLRRARMSDRRTHGRNACGFGRGQRLARPSAADPSLRHVPDRPAIVLFWVVLRASSAA